MYLVFFIKTKAYTLTISSINPFNVSFGYSHQLKTMWKKGLLPQVKKGFYGGELTLDNLSLEHLKPHSKGGRTTWENLVLATQKNNQTRGNNPLKDFIDIEKAKEHLLQFKDLKIGKFDGNKYIKSIIKTLSKEGLDIII